MITDSLFYTWKAIDKTSAKTCSSEGVMPFSSIEVIAIANGLYGKILVDDLVNFSNLLISLLSNLRWMPRVLSKPWSQTIRCELY